MKIHLVSDLHLEFAHIDLPGVDRDVLVVAGDLSSFAEKGKAIDFFNREFEKTPGLHIVFVPGNHEYYHGELRLVDEYWRRVSDDRPNFHFLNPGEVWIPDGKERMVQFTGACLWTAMDEDQKQMAKRYMTDYRLTKDLHPEAVHGIHKLHRSFIEKHALPGQVVVTHHSPSFDCVHDKYAGDFMNFAFHNDMDATVKKVDAAYWFFGHTHDTMDVQIGNTEVTCNPRGYSHGPEWPNENVNFKYDLVFEV